jgi:3-hydroxyisobutyrate dehydrogenase
LTVYDSAPGALRSFDGKARLGTSIADVGRNAEVVGVCVRDDNQVREVVEGDHGLLSVMPANSVIAVHSTVRPQTILDLAARGAARKVTLIDAAVSRTVMGGDGPFVVTMTGGEESVTKRIGTVLEKFSTDILHVGPLGSAMVLKITNNLVSWMSIVIARQAYDLARAGGVEADKLTHIMKQNGNLTPTMAAYLAMPQNLKGSKAAQTAFCASQAGIGQKDLELAASVAAELNIPVPSALHARELVHRAMLER